jgi:hypothetical protein
VCVIQPFYSYVSSRAGDQRRLRTTTADTASDTSDAPAATVAHHDAA